MQREERNQRVPCADCGATIVPDADRGYSFGSAGLVCWECAIRRGGRYDADRDAWVEAPDVTDILERNRDLR